MRPDSDRRPEVIAYYRQAVDRVLDSIESNPVTDGVRVFQLYSSSVLLQTPEVVCAIDLDQGPNRDLSVSPEEEGVDFRLKNEQVERLADVVDLSFHTHQHHDHIDHQLTAALLAAGKTVIITPEIMQMWENEAWAGDLTILDQTVEEPHEIGGLTVDLLRDHQWGNDMHTSGTVCNAYVIATSDVSIMAKGDINCGLRLYGWLQMLVSRGEKVEMLVGSPGYWRGIDCRREIDELLSPLWAPGHCWEFTHRPEGEARGNCGTFTSSHRSAENLAGPERAVVLTWGESIDLPLQTDG